MVFFTIYLIFGYKYQHKAKARPPAPIIVKAIIGLVRNKTFEAASMSSKVIITKREKSVCNGLS